MDLDYTKLPQALLDRERERAVDYNWWEYVYQDFIAELSADGVEVLTRPVRNAMGQLVEEPLIWFSLHVQGDTGFDACIYSWPTFFTRHELTEKLPMLVLPNMMCELSYSTNDGRSSLDCEFVFAGDDPFSEALSRLLDDELALAEGLIDAIFETYTTKLTKQLETEYEWLTSDECIIENLKNNHTDEEILEMIREVDEDAWEQLVELSA